MFTDRPEAPGASNWLVNAPAETATREVRVLIGDGHLDGAHDGDAAALAAQFHAAVDRSIDG